MTSSETRFCPYCGVEITPRTRKCKNCGQMLVRPKNSIPSEIEKFNWGAFLLNWIWGIMHKKYITLLYFPACIIPIIGPLAISIWFGVQGNKWAWNSKTWNSVQEFNENQQNWVRIWIILSILGLILLIKIMIFLSIIGNMDI